MRGVKSVCGRDFPGGIYYFRLLSHAKAPNADVNATTHAHLTFLLNVSYCTTVLVHVERPRPVIELVRRDQTPRPWQHPALEVSDPTTTSSSFTSSPRALYALDRYPHLGR